jgi:flagellar M-ring protein FliF
MLEQLREQSLKFWSAQTRVQRAALIGLVGAGVAAIALFLFWASTPTYAVAFNGLSEEDAGAIVEQLQANGTPYQIQDGGRILVPSAQVYEVRLRMARQGLPQGRSVGYELFSGNTLGMTEFMQRVNYQRALEGELERTIGSLDPIKAVRVHIVTPEKALLAREQAPTTASITVDFKPGRSLDAAQVRAVTHLVASSVEGLKPEHVVVVDVDGNLLTTADPSDPTSAGSQTDSRRAAEAAQAALIQNKVRSLLDQVLGPNKSVVQVSVTMDWTTRSIVASAVDPNQTALRSSQTLSETYTGDGLPIGGVPGAFTNLPPAPDTFTTGVTSTALYQRYETTTNYEVTQTETQSVVPAGRVERLSVSVLVDGLDDEAQLATLRTAIAAAAGITEARGDMLAVETLAFDRTFYEQQAQALEDASQMELYLQVALIVGGVLLLAALLGYVYRLIGNVRLASAEAWTVMNPAMAAAGTVPGGAVTAGRAGAGALGAGDSAGASYLPSPRPPLSPEDEQLQRVLLQLADEKPATVAEVIQLWLGEDDKHGPTASSAHR